VAYLDVLGAEELRDAGQAGLASETELEPGGWKPDFITSECLTVLAGARPANADLDAHSLGRSRDTGCPEPRLVVMEREK